MKANKRVRDLHRRSRNLGLCKVVNGKRTTTMPKMRKVEK